MPSKKEERRPRRHAAKAPQDLGFGGSLLGGSERYILPDGTFNVRREGRTVTHAYEWLIRLSWLSFFAVVLGFYVVFNVLFALLMWFMAGPEGFSGLTEGASPWRQFLDVFFFSIQTFTTVGYGSTSPASVSANILAALDAFTGLMSFALATGLLFARFSQARARILFSDNALIGPYRGDAARPSFQFRIVNQSSSQMMDLEAQVTFTWIEDCPGGRERRFLPLALERERVALFPLNWTIVHLIEEGSPLLGWTAAELLARHGEFLVIIKGYDETYGQVLSTMASYTAKEVVWGARWKPMFRADAAHMATVLELDKLNDFERL